MRDCPAMVLQIALVAVMASLTYALSHQEAPIFMPCAMRDSIAAPAQEADLASDPVEVQEAESGSALEQINEHLRCRGADKGSISESSQGSSTVYFLAVGAVGCL